MGTNMKTNLFFFLIAYSCTAFAQDGAVGKYKVLLNAPRQTIWGLGVEIQNDAIGSGNIGLPDKVVAVPNNLVAQERKRFYKELLKGFRYCRLAMGLYFRGLDSTRSRIVERYPNQLQDLKEMMQQSGMEGLAMEYWSPAPYWKSTNSYIGGTIRSTDTVFLNQFGDALADDIRYLQKSGLKISMWGLQNEAPHKNLNGQSYSHCWYEPAAYHKAFKAVAPKVRKMAPEALIMVDAWDGHLGAIGKLVQSDATALSYVDAWVLHRIGQNSNTVIADSAEWKENTNGKYVYQNEFEYFTGTSDTLFVNTAQSVMNWLTFANSPTWFWLHALKPTYNAEASGYSLGFWRPEDDNNFTKFTGIKKGHWDFNHPNFNALAGFLKYMPWNSVRYHVEEDVIRTDNRIMAFKTPNGKLVLVLTNRSGKPFTFTVATGINSRFKGYRFTPQQRNVPLKQKPGTKLVNTLTDLSVEFWVQQ
jgi:O-glycosyl hydrolase